MSGSEGVRSADDEQEPLQVQPARKVGSVRQSRRSRCCCLFILSATCFGFVVDSFRCTFPVHTAGAVLVTGCDHEESLGAAVAKSLASMGFTVFVTVRRDSGLALWNNSQHILPLLLPDVSDDAAVRAMFVPLQASLTRLGTPLVGVVNNAGVMLGHALSDVSAADLRLVFGTNVFGLMYVTREALTLLPRGGRVVNVGSLLGRVGLPGVNPYVASKWAVAGISDSLRREVSRRGIAVSLMEPGFFASAMCDPHKVRGPFCKTAGPEETAEATVHAITSCRPRKYYQTAGAMGIPTWLVLLFLQWTPTDVVDWMIGKL